MQRRVMLQAMAAIAAAGAARAQAGRAAVVYLTRSGNTAVFARALARARSAELFRLQVADPYPDDYEAHVERARRERDGAATPALRGMPDLTDVDTLFLGFPIWGGALPSPMRTFLTQADFRGTVVPFATHGGYGTGSALNTVAALAPAARIATPFVLECDQERRQLEQLNTWLRDVP